MGPAGVLQSYEEARNTLDLADRLGFRSAVLNAGDLLVFPVLLRDRAAITDLVQTVLGPLVQARGGAEPLLETLATFSRVTATPLPPPAGSSSVSGPSPTASTGCSV